MGCVSSKKIRKRFAGDIIVSPKAAFGGGTALEKIKEEPDKEGDEEESLRFRNSRRGEISGRSFSINLKFGRLTQAEHVAAGWPAWLSAVAGDAVDGWIPLKSDTFQRLEKIGQGTYSSVYRARNIETGQMVALKKVRFDNFQPESVRFMAREIRILRRLDHPNIMRLEGIITSKLSCNIYLVFEYMEHDLAGLISNPDIKFSDAQIKCYMRQLICGIEHCHAQGVIHRDIKTSNILVNNEGILKIADFGLANFSIAKNWQPLTSRVVTLWYRPPELLLGSTNYGGSVDLWSVGCVFAELFIGRPLLKGRTEVEQLHKIFKLCGTPPDEYWTRSKLPLAAMFKPHYPYESTLRERCRELPKTAVALLETFLSIEPYKRGTASSALDSEYFSSRPYACDPSSLPKYPPNKEIDAKFREDAKRRKGGSKMRASGASRNSRKVRKPLQEVTTSSQVVPTEEGEYNIYIARRNNAGYAHSRGSTKSLRPPKSSYDTLSEVSQVSEATQISQGESVQSVPLIVTSSDFALIKRQNQDSASSRSHSRRTSRSQTFNHIDPSTLLRADNYLDSNRLDDIEISSRLHTAAGDLDKNSKRTMQRQQSIPNRLDILDSSELYPSQDSYDYDDDHVGKGRFSGPLIPLRSDDGSQENHSHQAVRRSRFYEE